MPVWDSNCLKSSGLEDPAPLKYGYDRPYETIIHAVKPYKVGHNGSDYDCFWNGGTIKGKYKKILVHVSIF